MSKKKNISKKDIDTWNSFIKNPTNIFDKEQSLLKNKTNNSRLKYDLHGLTLLEANKKVKELIFSCAKKNFKEILLITGKGIHSNTENNRLSNLFLQLSDSFIHP